MIRPSPAPGPDAPHPPALSNGHIVAEGGKEAAERYAAGLARGDLPSLRQVQRQMHLGQPRAREVRSYLDVLASNNGHQRGAAGGLAATGR